MSRRGAVHDVIQRIVDVKERREDRAQEEVRRRRLALEDAARRLEQRRKELDDYKVWRVRREIENGPGASPSEVVRKALNNDRDFARLLTYYLQHSIRVARSNRHGDDVAQGTLLKIWKGQPEIFLQDHESVLKYLSTATRRNLITQAEREDRRSSRRKTGGVEDDAPDPIDRTPAATEDPADAFNRAAVAFEGAAAPLDEAQDPLDALRWTLLALDPTASPPALTIGPADAQAIGAQWRATALPASALGDLRRAAEAA